MTTAPSANPNKVYDSADSALTGICDGASMFVGGFAGHHRPQTLLQAVIASGVRDLTVICQGTSAPGAEDSALIGMVESGQVRKIVSPLPFDPRQGGPVKRLWETGLLDLEVQPVGVLAERIRAGGAGIGGSFLPIGPGTRFAEERETRVIDGHEFVFHPSIKADFALLRASVADSLGNLVYGGTGRNWNPVMAMAARVSIAEVDEIREPGGIDPEAVITPAIFVQRLVLGSSSR